MNYESLFPTNVKSALMNDPPGAWMPQLPEPCIRLSAGYPAPELVPSEQVKSAVNRLIHEESDLPLHYLGSPRLDVLRAQLQERLKHRGIDIRERELLVTSGGCQAIDLIAKVLLDHTCVVAVEAPTYMEALEIFRNYTNQIVSIPMDELGLQTDVLETMLMERRDAGLPMPRFLYTIPSFHNPTGTTLPTERRLKLLKLAEAFDFLIVEDDAYGELSFAHAPVPLKAMDRSRRVVYVGSLSKVVAPGLRVGWIAGPQPLVHACSWFKKDLDHPFAQATMAVYLQDVDFAKRVEALRAAYRKRRDTMVRALDTYMPAFVSWHVPQGGFFVWLHIPEIDTTKLLNKSLDRGVSFVPGQYFFANQADGRHFLRLSFSYVDEEQMVKGVQTLGQLLT
jgi:2-aminoadipate transaminase